MKGKGNEIGHYKEHQCYRDNDDESLTDSDSTMGDIDYDHNVSAFARYGVK